MTPVQTYYETLAAAMIKKMEKGCYFIEFLSTEEAVFVYENCNNLQVNNLFIKVKWVKLSQKTPKKKSSKKYSVIINNLI